jgi:hypothetical protein
VCVLTKYKEGFMKKILAILILLQSSMANAYEYSSDHDDRQNDERERIEWVESHSRQTKHQQHYQQNYQQPPIQIYLAPNQNSTSHSEQYRQNSNSNQFGNQYREEHYWRERREDLENQPQRPYRENSFYGDENHW